MTYTWCAEQESIHCNKRVAHLFACRYVVDGSAHEPLGTSMVFRTAETELMPKTRPTSAKTGATIDLDTFDNPPYSC